MLRIQFKQNKKRKEEENNNIMEKIRPNKKKPFAGL